MHRKADDKLIFEAYIKEKKCKCGKKTCKVCHKEHAKETVEEAKRKKCKGKKMMKEHHEVFGDEVLHMTLGQLLDELEASKPELYHEIENYLENKKAIKDNPTPPVEM